VQIQRDPPKTSHGKIELSNPEKSWWGTVLATGPGYHDTKTGRVRPMTVKKGDRVLVLRGVGHSMNGDDTVIVVGEGQILGREQ